MRPVPALMIWSHPDISFLLELCMNRTGYLVGMVLSEGIMCLCVGARLGGCMWRDVIWGEGYG